MSQRLALIQSRISTQGLNQVYIVAAKRTPIGTYMGSLSSLTAPELGSVAIKAALASKSIDPKSVEEVILGNVLSAGVGQAPARQAALLGGLEKSVICTTINKVCSSGMKSIIYGSQSIALGHSGVVVAGGIESMSNAPHLVMNARKGIGHGDKVFVDHLTHEGLTDPFKKISMGLCAEKTAGEMQITREDQDKYCIETFKRHIEASKNGLLKDEIAPVTIAQKGKSKIVDKDEEYLKYKEEMIGKLKPAFKKDGTVTSANASKINDGACSVVLMSQKKMEQLKVQPLARIIAYADYEMEPVDFCQSPYFASMKALQKAELKVSDIDYFEFNEAFSVVPIAMMKMMKIGNERINVFGGAVAMGHPIGVSGARIVQSLLTVMKAKGGKYGLAGICNGGGGSTAIILENLQS